MTDARTSPNDGLAAQLLAGLTVSFVAISLGGAFGVLSGRGALAGILSAGVIALIASTFGGTRVQCSGPTAPMTAVTVLLIAAISEGLLDDYPAADPDQFINMVVALTGVLLVLAGALRLGRFIQLVPQVVLSGFMNGIAVLIWVSEVDQLFAIGKPALGGGMLPNLAIALFTLAAVFLLPGLFARIDQVIGRRTLSFIPGTLGAIIITTVGVAVVELDVAKISLGATISSFADVSALLGKNVPTQWSMALVLVAIPFAFQLAMLAYLDTLLTSLVVDEKAREMYGGNEVTAQSQELAAQGVANAAVSVFGGLPGAQATIRSVLILNEGATKRIAGVAVGVFVLIEMVLFQDLISTIPQAVFSGVLLKVGYDVFHWDPVVAYLRQKRSGSSVHEPRTGEPRVSDIEMLFIVGTTSMTVAINLNVAVVTFCIVFYAWRRFWPIADLAPYEEQQPA